MKRQRCENGSTYTDNEAIHNDAAGMRKFDLHRQRNGNTRVDGRWNRLEKGGFGRLKKDELFTWEWRLADQEKGCEKELGSTFKFAAGHQMQEVDYIRITTYTT